MLLLIFTKDKDVVYQTEDSFQAFKYPTHPFLEVLGCTRNSERQFVEIIPSERRDERREWL